MAIPSNEQVVDVVSRYVGGTVVRIERQLRWRPTWFVDVERDGEVELMVLRGDRTDSEAFPLRQEYAFHRMLEERGFRVPKLYSYIETPGFIDAVLMERVPGKADFAGVNVEVRDRVVVEYVQQLAQLHAVDPAPFVEAGIVHPALGENSGVVGYRHIERRYRERKQHTDPFAEFCLGWHKRHVPDGKGGRIYARYEGLTGAPIDIEAVKRHHFAACMGNQLRT